MNDHAVIIRKEFSRSGLEERMLNILTPLSSEFGFQLSEQYPESRFIIDFVLFFDVDGKKKIAIEVDGNIWHQHRKKKDRFKDYILRKQGWKVLRFNENFRDYEVRESITAVVDAWNRPG